MRPRVIFAMLFCFFCVAWSVTCAEQSACVPQMGDGRVCLNARIMGTLFTVQAYPGAGMDDAATQAVCLDVLKYAHEWEKTLSAKDAEAELFKLNAAPHGAETPISPELREALVMALDCARLTDGAFDPTLGACVRLWKKSLRTGKLPDVNTLNRALNGSGWQNLQLTERGVIKTVEGMRIDLGGIGKGFTVGKMAEKLKKAGIKSFCIDTTSDVCVGAPPPGKEGWSIKVNRGDSFEKLLVTHACISTSGDSRQFAQIGGVRYSHVLNPKTGLGVTERWQLSVMAQDAALADALATAGCVLGKQAFEKMAGKIKGVKVLSFFKRE